MIRRLFVIAIVLTASLPSMSCAEEPDWRDWDALMQQYVSSDKHAGVMLNWVDYSGLRKDSRFDRVVKQLATFPPERLVTREEKLAFYINAYNVLAIKTVLDHWPLKSIKDAGSFFSPVWGRDAGTLGGQTVTLDQIEHEILRPMGEPRIHMAIVCASISCPDLRQEAYTADRLDAQLDDQSRQFLANRAKGARKADGDLLTSKIFDWFEEDFTPLPGGLPGFLQRYGGFSPDLRIDADLPYNWSLNGD